MAKYDLPNLSNKYGKDIVQSLQKYKVETSIDLGMHILPPSQKDLENLETILAANTFDKPNVKLSVYKNRRGRYKGVYLWCKADLGICRIKPMFCTTWDYEIQSIEDLKIFTKEEEEGAFD